MDKSPITYTIAQACNYKNVLSKDEGNCWLTRAMRVMGTFIYATFFCCGKYTISVEKDVESVIALAKKNRDEEFAKVIETRLGDRSITPVPGATPLLQSGDEGQQHENPELTHQPTPDEGGQGISGALEGSLPENVQTGGTVPQNPQIPVSTAQTTGVVGDNGGATQPQPDQATTSGGQTAAAHSTPSEVPVESNAGGQGTEQAPRQVTETVTQEQVAPVAYQVSDITDAELTAELEQLESTPRTPADIKDSLELMFGQENTEGLSDQEIVVFRKFVPEMMASGQMPLNEEDERFLVQLAETPNALATIPEDEVAQFADNFVQVKNALNEQELGIFEQLCTKLNPDKVLNPIASHTIQFVWAAKRQQPTQDIVTESAQGVTQPSTIAPSLQGQTSDDRQTHRMPTITEEQQNEAGEVNTESEQTRPAIQAGPAENSVEPERTENMPVSLASSETATSTEGREDGEEFEELNRAELESEPQASQPLPQEISAITTVTEGGWWRRQASKVPILNWFVASPTTHSATAVTALSALPGAEDLIDEDEEVQSQPSLSSVITESDPENEGVDRTTEVPHLSNVTEEEDDNETSEPQSPQEQASPGSPLPVVEEVQVANEEVADESSQREDVIPSETAENGSLTPAHSQIDPVEDDNGFVMMEKDDTESVPPEDQPQFQEPSRINATVGNLLTKIPGVGKFFSRSSQSSTTLGSISDIPEEQPQLEWVDEDDIGGQRMLQAAKDYAESLSGGSSTSSINALVDNPENSAPEEGVNQTPAAISTKIIDEQEESDEEEVFDRQSILAAVGKSHTGRKPSVEEQQNPDDADDSGVDEEFADANEQQDWMENYAARAEAPAIEPADSDLDTDTEAEAETDWADALDPETAKLLGFVKTDATGNRLPPYFEAFSNQENWDTGQQYDKAFLFAGGDDALKAKKDSKLAGSFSSNTVKAQTIYDGLVKSTGGTSKGIFLTQKYSPQIFQPFRIEQKLKEGARVVTELHLPPNSMALDLENKSEYLGYLCSLGKDKNPEDRIPQETLEEAASTTRMKLMSGQYRVPDTVCIMRKFDEPSATGNSGTTTADLIQTAVLHDSAMFANQELKIKCLGSGRLESEDDTPADSLDTKVSTTALTELESVQKNVTRKIVSYNRVKNCGELETVPDVLVYQTKGDDSTPVKMDILRQRVKLSSPETRRLRNTDEEDKYFMPVPKEESREAIMSEGEHGDWDVLLDTADEDIPYAHLVRIKPEAPVGSNRVDLKKMYVQYAKLIDPTADA